LKSGRTSGTNLVTEILNTDSSRLFREIESGKHELKLPVMRGGETFFASIQWIPEPDWVVARFVRQDEIPRPDPATQITVQELLQEREITYRNLLAAY